MNGLVGDPLLVGGRGLPTPVKSDRGDLWWRRNPAVHIAVRSPVINYRRRASVLEGIVNTVDRRRSSLSRSERPAFSA